MSGSLPLQQDLLQQPHLMLTASTSLPFGHFLYSLLGGSTIHTLQPPSVLLDITTSHVPDAMTGQARHSPRCWGSLPPRFTSRDTLLPHCLISSMASACVMSLVDLPLISISWSPTWNNRWTVLCNPQHKEWHVVELTAATDAEAKASCASLQLHAVVLPILSCLTLRLHHHHHNTERKI
ncbi:hypothetical protein E2C01_006211 [Portunus trituberculatus]|uniref:Uncharacterized protein n=1 Tax=Portunus trituberculatus TaxID=210409 RepID=A0A5B7CWI0_PORTR|nr:hypothetical protein [Portunus trituberculatus]